MNVQTRILTIRLLERMEQNSSYCEHLRICDASKLNSGNSKPIEIMGGTNMAVRKIRSDCKVGTAERSRGLPPGSIRNPNGRDARSDKRIGKLREDYAKEGGK